MTDEEYLKVLKVCGIDLTSREGVIETLEIFIDSGKLSGEDLEKTKALLVELEVKGK